MEDNKDDVREPTVARKGGKSFKTMDHLRRRHRKAKEFVGLGDADARRLLAAAGHVRVKGTVPRIIRAVAAEAVATIVGPALVATRNRRAHTVSAADVTFALRNAANLHYIS